ncbi:MAG: DUF3267 domain-containing protein [Phycisphaerae bacterium]
MMMVPAASTKNVMATRPHCETVGMRRGLCYVLHDSPVSRNRILVVLLAPVMVMSSVLAAGAALVPSGWGLVIILAMLVHMAVCTGDLIAFVLVITQVPMNARVHNDGWKTYWTPLP